MRYVLRCEVSEEEYAMVADYVAHKRRWAKIGHFVRDACFQTMERYPCSASKVAGKSLGGTARVAGGLIEGKV